MKQALVSPEVANLLLEACRLIDQAEGMAVDMEDFETKYESAVRAVRAALKAYETEVA